MKRTLAYTSLMFLSFLAGCPSKRPVAQQAPPPDYDAIREDAESAHKALDNEKGPLGR